MRIIVFMMCALFNIGALYALNCDVEKRMHHKSHFDKKINLNTASICELIHSYPGIGEIRAKNIVKERQRHGRYKHVSELDRVPGVSHKFVQKNLKKLENVYIVN